MMSKSLKLLWVKTGPLYPLDTGGKKRTCSMLVELSKQHEVTYLALKNRKGDLTTAEAEAGYASRKVWVPWRESSGRTPKFFAELLGNLVFSSLPYALAKYREVAMEAEIAHLCAGESFDLVICDFLAPAANFLRIRNRLGVPTVLFQHNVEAQIWRRLAAGKHNPVARWYFGIQFRRMARWERRLSAIFDGVIMVSPEDAEFARREYGLRNILGDVPTGVDADYFQPGEQGGGKHPTIGFLGSMDWMPNVEAVRWFVSEIFPDLKSAVPGVRFLVIGRRPPASIKALAARDRQIEVTGTVDDVRPFLRECDLLTVPLLSGGGTRIKIMEALAAGLPVVSTTIGAEGLGLVDGKHLLIADSAAEFAAAVKRLLSDQEVRWRLSAQGRQLVLTDFSWERATNVFLEHCQKVCRGLVSQPGPRQNR